MVAWFFALCAQRRRIRRMLRGLPISKVRKAAYYNPTVMARLPGRGW